MSTNNRTNSSSGDYNIDSKDALTAFFRLTLIFLSGFIINFILIILFYDPTTIEKGSFIGFSILFIGMLYPYMKFKQSLNSYLSNFQKTYTPPRTVYPVLSADFNIFNMGENSWFLWEIISTPQDNHEIESCRTRLNNDITLLILFMIFSPQIWLIFGYFNIP